MSTIASRTEARCLLVAHACHAGGWAKAIDYGTLVFIANTAVAPGPQAI
jgi:hypothetical protein